MPSRRSAASSSSVFSTGTVASVSVCQFFEGKRLLRRRIRPGEALKAAPMGCLPGRHDRIAQHRRVRAVKREVGPLGIALGAVPDRRVQPGEMSPGGKAAHGDFLRRNTKLVRVRPYPRYRLGERMERPVPEGRRLAVVAQHEALDTASRERAADRCALPNGAVLVAAAGAQNERGLIPPSLRGKTGQNAARELNFLHFRSPQTL